MEILIRAEEIRDYYRISEIQALAFHREGYIGEIQLVDAQRHGSAYNPHLSLVVEVDGVVAGHAFFYPHRMQIGGEIVPAVSLAPLAVHPDYQRTGLGARLMEEGHARARASGYALSFLLGHESYYPRFGYQIGMFGQAGIQVAPAELPVLDRRLQLRPVSPPDIPMLMEMWYSCFEGVDLAIIPGDSIIDWVSHSSHLTSAVVYEAGQLTGYLRYSTHNQTIVTCLLTSGKSALLSILSYLGSLPSSSPSEPLAIPLHPNSPLIREADSLPHEPILVPWKAAMIKILDPDLNVVHEYCQEVSSGQRPIGLILYPPIFETA
jgi:putative acetyltransferase